MADRKRHPVARTVLAVVAVLIATVLLLGFTHCWTTTCSRTPESASDDDAAMAKANALTAADGPESNPLCASQVLSHGERTSPRTPAHPGPAATLVRSAATA